MTKIAVNGAAGRMGRRIIALAMEMDNVTLAGAMEGDGNEALGKDAGLLAGAGEANIVIASEPARQPDVIIDFSIPAATMARLHYCTEHKIGMVIGTTGFTEEQYEKLQTAANEIPILLSANMSLGVNLLFKLAAEVAQSLNDDYDIEIVEAHHRFKRDAPSGTALEIAKQIATAKGWQWPDCMEQGRYGKEALRKEKTIGMHSVRAGDIVGKHEIIFATLGESIKLEHQAHSRDTFARGALAAALWLDGQKAGRYNMFNVLGMNS